MEASEKYPKASGYLAAWVGVVRVARWRSLIDLRKVYPSADPVEVASKKRVIVFNVCGNTYRLVVAIHFDKQRVYTLRFMTHAEYSKDEWKRIL